jgi:hypothetical protein
MKPEIHLHGWQSVQSYRKAKGYQNTQYVYELIKKGKLESIRLEKELNNLLLVRTKQR